MYMIYHRWISAVTTTPSLKTSIRTGPFSHHEVGGLVEAVERNSLRTTNKARMTVVATHSGDNPESWAAILDLRQFRLQHLRQLLGRRVAVVDQVIKEAAEDVPDDSRDERPRICLVDRGLVVAGKRSPGQQLLIWPGPRNTG